MATAAATDPSSHLMDVEISDNPNSIAESGSNNNNTSATDTMDTRNATGTLDEDTSSIEALNWCEFDEEEMASAKNPDIVKKEGQTMDIEGGQEPAGSSSVPLSTSLLKSIDSQMPEDDKITKIENWASDVISATEDQLLGDLEAVTEGGEISVSTSSTTVYQQVPDSGEGIDNADKGTRKRTSKSNIMSMSTISSLSNADSKGDPLSHAPVLDEGPIWGKGSKRYKFQENRRFNQKLTFGVLLSVVLAIGLGLGNLVAYNECEAEYKATTTTTPSPPTVETPTEDNSAQVPTTTIPTEKAQEITKEQLESPEKLVESDPTDVPKELPEKISLPDPAEINNVQQEPVDDGKKSDTPASSSPEESPKVLNTKPFVDPSYASHAEALASVVKSLDQLSRKIDQFQNTTRQLGGIVMLKEEVINELRSKSNAKDAKKGTEKSELLEEEVHPDLSDEEMLVEDIDEGEDMIVVEDLIDAIEENEAYDEKQLQKEDLARRMKESHIKDETYASMEALIWDYMDALDGLDNKFIEKERARVLEERIKLEEDGNLDKPYRSFSDYSEEEKKSLLTRYKQFKRDQDTEQDIASGAKKLLVEQLQSAESTMDTENEEVSLESDLDLENYDEEIIIEEMNDNVGLGWENMEHVFHSDHNIIEETVPIRSDDSDSKLPNENEGQQKNSATVDDNNNIHPDSYDSETLNTQEYKESRKNGKEMKDHKKRDKSNGDKGQKKSKDKQTGKENKPNKKFPKDDFNEREESSSEEKNRSRSSRNKRSVKDDNKKWRDLSSEEKRNKYATGNHYNKEKSKKQAKSQRFSDTNANVQSEDEERQHMERSKWKKPDKDWAAERAKLRENNRKSFEDSSTYLAKKNKNWQLDRDRAREKFRNKNKGD